MGVSPMEAAARIKKQLIDTIGTIAARGHAQLLLARLSALAPIAAQHPSARAVAPKPAQPTKQNSTQFMEKQLAHPGDSKSPAIALSNSSAIDSGVKVTPADKLIGHSGVKVTPTDKLVGTSGVKVTPTDKLVGTWTSLFRRMGDAVGALISTKISGVKMTPADKLDEATPNSKSTITVLNLHDE
ncbi:hypothetical protein T492DRAFT_900750 [Pavlovales sp. CCMP2436]|nr:hypothetical protein T492DRAFT_900750 [Pavlovales sp. CCMP2436]